MTKKILAVVIAMIMLIACFSFTASAEGTFEIVSAKLDTEKFSVTFTFSEPVRIFSRVYVYFCTRPSPSGEIKDNGTPIGIDQCNSIDAEYIDPTVVGGLEYSDKITIYFEKPADLNKLLFSKGDVANATQLGVRFTEYGDSADFGNGTISAKVIRTADGKVLSGNYKSGQVDICWVPAENWASAMPSRGWSGYVNGYTYDVTMETVKPEIAVINAVEADRGKIEFSFTQKLKLQSGYQIDAGGNKSVSVTAFGGGEYDATYVVDFGKDVSEATEYSIPADMFVNDAGVKLGESCEGELSDFPLPEFDDISDKFESGAEYSFMNTDTGRMLTVDGKTQFKLDYNGEHNKYALLDEDGRYVNLQTMTLSSERYLFDIELNNDYERYQLIISNGSKVLYDDDTGNTNAAAIAHDNYGNNNIETGWYITKKGDALPKKFVCYGDSITCGVIPTADNNNSTLKPGYRKELSAMLLEEYGRVVFVGSLKHAKGTNTTAITNTLITDGFLYRHEGHSGWTIESGHYPTASTPDHNHGLSELREGLQTKYAPDVVFMMIGINDVGLNSGGYSGNETALTTIANRWETLVRNILEDLPEDGLLFGASLTPRTNSSGQWHTSQNEAISKLNAKYAAIVAKINAEGDNRLVTADNFTYVKNAGTGALSSDTIHVSISGFTALANSYFDAYKANYKAPAERIVGDINGDNQKNADDAIYLLYNVFFGDEEYPLSVDADVNGDNKKNADDAIYLLYNVFFGDTEYPLYPEANEEENDENNWTGNY